MWCKDVVDCKGVFIASHSMHTHLSTLTQKAAIKALKKGTLPDSKLYHRRDIRLSKIRIQNTQPNVFVIFINFLKSKNVSDKKFLCIYPEACRCYVISVCQ